MRNKKTLFEQALIEQKKRQISKLKLSEFNPKKKYSEQLRALLPNINFIEKQKKYIDAKQTIKWYKGGYKSGKTFTGIAVDIWLAFVNKPYPGMLVHQTMDGNEITILPLIEEICQANNIDYDVKKLRTKFKVIFNFGKGKAEQGVLYLASGDSPKSLKGPKLAFGHVDEPLIQKEEITQVILSRLAEKHAVLRMLQYTGTPEPEHMQWGFDICDKESEDSKNRYITTISTHDVAQFLPKGYIEEMSAEMTPGERETFINGNYRNLKQGAVYENFDSKESMWDPITNQPDRGINEETVTELVLSYDFNVNQMSAVLHEIRGRIETQIKEFRIQSRSDTAELTKMVIARLRAEGLLVGKHTRYGKSLIISGDAAGKAGSSKSKKTDYQIILEEFEAEGIEIVIVVPDANPAVRDRINYVNRRYAAKTLWLSKDCPLTKRDRELMVWKLGANGFVIDKSKKEISHLGEAADYGIYNTMMISESDDSNTGGVRNYKRPER